MNTPHIPQEKTKVKYLTKLEQIPELISDQRQTLDKVVDTFVFRTNDYYQSLIKWDDPNDPIKRLIIPDAKELNDEGELDASNEHAYTVARGLEYKYDSTVIMLVNETCGAYCRFCFRKRLFMDDNDEVTKDISEAVEYIKTHPEINNVLFTGGDPMVMSTSKLEPLVRQVREIDHVRIIRIGTKMPAFNPYRIIDDPSLLEMIERYTTPTKKIYIVAHFNHPVEITDPAIKCINLLQKAGAMMVHQTPIIKGVNDDPLVMNELLNEMSFLGVTPYYVFQCRPTAGNETFSVPLERAFEIFEMARVKCSGLAKRARFAMSHASGKIEVVGLTPDQIFFKYHRAARNGNSGKFMAFKRNPNAYWFDDYIEAQDANIIDFPLSALNVQEWVDWGLMDKS